MLILFIAMMSSVVCFGQLQEVKGVETKLVIYEGSSYHVGDSDLDYSSKWFGYSFYNMNSIPVSVEAKLYRYRKGGNYNQIVNTKTFNLKSQETYIWKHEEDYSFRVYGSSDYPRKEPYDYSGQYYYYYYVEYKAYKIL